MKNRSLNVPASAFTGSSITGRVEAATPNNLRAVAEPGKSFKWLTKLSTNTPAITATAMLIASTAGLRSVFFQVLGGGNQVFFREPLGRLGRNRNKTNHARNGAIEILLIDKFGGAVRTRYCQAHGTVGQLTRADRSAVQKRALPAH